MDLTSSSKAALCLLLIAMLPFCAVGVAPIVGPNRIYALAGVYTFSTTPYLNTLTTNLNPLTFAITFAARIQSTVNYHFGYTIHELNYQFVAPSLNISLWVPGPKQPTAISAQLFTSNANKISVLRIGYVLIEPLFVNIGFAYAWLQPQTNIVSGQNFSQVVSGVGPFAVGSVSVWKVLVGFDASLASNKLFDCRLQVSVLSATSLQFTVTSLSTTAYFLNSLVVGVFIFDPVALMGAPRQARFSTGLLNSPTLRRNDIANEIRLSNSIVGVFSHALVNKGTFSQVMDINSRTWIQGTSSLAFLQLGLSYLILQFITCSGTTPFLMLGSPSSVCLNACPFRYYADIYSECVVCPYDCYSCVANGSCLTCSSSLDFRVLNTTTRRCDARVGFVDNGFSSAAIRCSSLFANCLQCSLVNSTTICAFCLSGYFYNVNSCQPCPLYCSTCTSSSQCSACFAAFTLVSGVCNLTCSVITNCLTCLYNTSSPVYGVTCSTCNIGHYLVNNSCPSNCGNNVVLGSEGCDDGNLVDGDGCSTNCTIEPYYFCSSNTTNLSGSICELCLDSCITCSNATECISCIPGYTLIDNSTNCTLVCSIPFCSVCNYTTQLNCQSCDLGYELLVSGCFQVCGDGLRTVSQQCDDGNTNSSDGCMSCLIQSGYFCTDVLASGAVFPTSQCGSCLPNCIFCTSVTVCFGCQSGFVLVSSNSSASCMLPPRCGDGIVFSTDICDDGNTVNGDGCSDTCQVEPNFSCLVDAGGTSVCSLTSLTVDVINIEKSANSNSFAVTYALSPSVSVLSTVDWLATVQQQSSLNAQITGVVYDPSSGQLQVTMQYSQSVDGQSLVLTFGFPPSAPFDNLPPVSTTVALSASNNLSLEVYSEEEYAMAPVFQKVSLGLAIAAVGFFLLGFFSGKLIALEMVAVFQLTYFSLLSLESLSPTFSALRLLSLSCGYSLKIVPNLLAHRRFTGIGLNYPFLNNYNLVVGLLLLPPLLSIVLSLVNRCRYNGTHVKLLLYSRLLRGEFVFYSLLFSAYLLVVAAGITIQRMDYLSGIFLAGAAIDGALLLLLLIYTVLLAKRVLFFGEYVDKFQKNHCFSSYYYCWMVMERVVVGVVLTIVQIHFQSAVIAGLLVLQIIVVGCVRPYRDEQKGRSNPNLRPILNISISLIIQFILCFQALFPSLLRSFSSYLPLIVLILLVCTIPYNLYYWIRNLCAKTETERQLLAQEEAKFINSERMRVENMNSTLIKQNPSILFTATKRITEVDQSKLMLSMSNIKEKFSKFKALERDKRMLNHNIPIQIDGFTDEPTILAEFSLPDEI